MEPALTLEEAAASLGIHVWVVKRMIRDGLMLARKDGTISAVDIDDFDKGLAMALQNSKAGAPLVLDWPTSDLKIGGIYYIRSGLYVKIGVSGNIAKRVRALRSGSPKRLALAAWEGGRHDQERRLHTEFKHLRVSGEWFKFNGAISARVGELNKSYLGLGG